MAVEKRDLRTYANSEDPDHLAHPHSLVGIFAVSLHNIETLLNSDDLDPTSSRICPKGLFVSPEVQKQY